LILVAARFAAAIGIAAMAAPESAEPTTTLRAASIVAAGVAGRSHGNLTSHGARNHFAAGDAFFIRNADANRAAGLARNLTVHVNRAFLNAGLVHALVGADLDAFFFPHGFANRNLGANSFGVANLLANGHRAFAILWAMNPNFAGASAGSRAASVARIAARAVAVTAEEVAEERLHFAAFPVAQTDQLFLHADFLNVLVASLVDDPVFIHGHLVADLANFVLVNRDLPDDADSPFTTLRDRDTAEGVVLFRATLDPIRGPFDLIRFAHPFGTSDGAIAGTRRCRLPTWTPTSRRPVICPSGGNRHGGNGANQQCKTKRLADHAFSLVIHADPVCPTDTHRWD
jgi:hypothetical protein